MSMVDTTSSGDSADQPARQSDTSNFDIVAAYNELLVSDPNVTKPIAAINALINLLNTTPSSTVHETLEIIKTHTERLKASVANPLPLAAGTDLFLQYIITSLKQQDGNFDAIRQHLLGSGRVFAQRAAEERQGVAEAGWRYVTEGSTVMTYGASRCVTTLLERAAKTRSGKFKVIYVEDQWQPAEGARVVRQLRAMGIPTSVISIASVGEVFDLTRKVSMVMVGAEVVMQSGGIISRTGTLTIAQVAKRVKVPVYVCAETHKFNRKHLYDQTSWRPFQQDMLDFHTGDEDKLVEHPVDFTRPEFIDQLITENGLKVPAYVIERILETYDSLDE